MQAAPGSGERGRRVRARRAQAGAQASQRVLGKLDLCRTLAQYASQMNVRSIERRKLAGDQPARRGRPATVERTDRADPSAMEAMQP